MGANTSTELGLGADTYLTCKYGCAFLDPEEEKHILKYMLMHLRDRSGHYDKVNLQVLQNCFEIPVKFVLAMFNL